MDPIAVMHDETPIPLASLRKHIHSPPPYRRLWRWVKKGLPIKRGPRRGERVTLEHCYQGGVLMTSVEAYYRFLRTINGEEKEDGQSGRNS